MCNTHEGSNVGWRFLSTNFDELFASSLSRISKRKQFFFGYEGDVYYDSLWIIVCMLQPLLAPLTYFYCFATLADVTSANPIHPTYTHS